MLRTILFFGAIAGVIVIAPMSVMAVNTDHGSLTRSMIVGFAIMIAAFSLIFVGVKRFRDHARGGVIRFLPAFLMGLGISAVASLIYVIGWEITLAATDMNFMESYSAAVIAEAKARGASGAELAALARKLAKSTADYANPLYRMPVTFTEIFPVGFIISLISAALLCNRRFLPLKVAEG
ncbi:MAG: DUF4199 domain-containing protein [Pseudomonadota bacterium]